MTTTEQLTRLSAARTAYYENADYLTTGSTAKAAAFVAACTQLVGLLAKSGSLGGTAGEQFSFDIQAIREEGMAAKKFLSTARGATSKIMHERFCRE